MLETVLEIVVFMVAAAGLGLVLGWVLRGLFGNEQAELSDARAQLRKLKRARREQEAALKTEQQQAVVAEVKREGVAESTQPKPETEAESDVSISAAEAKQSDEKIASVVKKETTKKKASKKKQSAKSDPKPKKKVAAKRKTKAEREADQAAARQAFAEVAAKVGAADSRDKLTKIYGVGKRYEEMLNELGLSSYAQIAQLKKSDVRVLAGALGVLDDRLESEDWVGSAKKLLKESSS